MEKTEVLAEEVSINVRWLIPPDAMRQIIIHQGIMKLIRKGKKVSIEEAAIDLIRSKQMPKIIITHENPV